MYDDVGSGTFRLAVTARGDISDSAVEYARAKIAHALAFAHRPARRAHVVLELHRDPAMAHPAEVDVAVDVGGLAVHAEASARTMTEAIDRAESRLRGQFVRLHGQALDRRRPRQAWPASR